MTWKIFSLSVILLLTFAEAKPCVKKNKKNTCEKSSSATDCDAGTLCMEIFNGQSGTSGFYCGVPQSSGCSCDPSLPAVEACASGMSCKPTKCSKNGCKYECSPFSEDEPQCQNEPSNHWTLVYDHDQTGAAVSGSYADLKEAIDEGAEVKFMTNFGLFSVHKVSIGSLENIEAVCGQALFWMPYSPGPSSFSIYSIACTTGNVHLTSLRPGEPENSSAPGLPYLNSNIQRPIKWFVRKGSTLVSADADLITVALNGGSLRNSLHTDVNDTYRPLETTAYSQLHQTVFGTAIWEMRDHLAGREFLTQEQWLHSHWHTNNTVQGSSWVVHTHDKTADFFKQLDNVTWYADMCWKLVYRHDNNGNAVSGSLNSLVQGAKQGKRVKIRLNNVLYEANKVEIADDESSVTVQVYDSLCEDLTDATWCWLIVSTDGSVTTITTPVGVSDPQFDESTSSVAWFLDDRTWTLTASLDSSGTAIDGTSLQNLSFAYDGGADFRYCFSRNNKTECLQADQVTRLGNNFMAYHDRELEIEETGGVKTDAFRRYTFTFTLGQLRAKKYDVEGLFVQDEAPESLAVKWFTSEY